MAASQRISQYGQGFTSGVIIRGLPVNQVHPGEVFWVNNSTVLPDGGVGGSNGNKGSYLQPFSTVDYAVGQCSSGRGDIIMVMPGHAETFTTVAGSGTSLNLDVAGIAIVGLGTGTKRPTFTFTTLGATHGITVSAANISVSNCIFVANFDAVSSCFLLTTAAEFNCEGNEFRDTAASLNFQSIVTTNATANTADGLRFHNNKVFGLDVNPLAVVSILEANYRVEVSKNYCNLVATSSGGELVTLAAFICLNLIIRGNNHRYPEDRATGLLLTGSGSTSTGLVAENYVTTLTGTSDIISTTSTGLKFFNNYHSGAVDVTGYLLPAVDGA